MNDVSKQTRKWLNDSNREDFENIVYKAKLSPRQEEITRKKFLDGRAEFQIAIELGYSTKTIHRELIEVYGRVSKLL